MADDLGDDWWNEEPVKCDDGEDEDTPEVQSKHVA